MPLKRSIDVFIATNTVVTDIYIYIYTSSRLHRGIDGNDDFAMAAPLSTPSRITDYSNVKELAEAISTAHSAIHTNLRSISVSCNYDI